MAEHFPTFSWFSHLVSRGLRRVSWKSLRSERGILRAILYLLFIYATITHVLFYFWDVAGFRSGYGYAVFGPVSQPESLTEWVGRALFGFLGSPPLPGLIAFVCLIVLTMTASNSRAGHIDDGRGVYLPELPGEVERGKKSARPPLGR